MVVPELPYISSPTKPSSRFFVFHSFSFLHIKTRVPATDYRREEEGNQAQFFCVSMAENKQIPPPQFDLNAKWDACLDLTVRRSVYSSLAGAFGGLLLFRSPVTRWASVAFGAGIGIGSAYSECSRKFDGSAPKLTPPSKVSEVPVSQVEQD